MKNRMCGGCTVIGIICMVLAAVVMFGVAPLVNRLTSDTKSVIRISQDVKQGSQISDALSLVTETAEPSPVSFPTKILHPMEVSTVGEYMRVKSAFP